MPVDFVILPIYYGRSFAPGPGQGSFTFREHDAALAALCGNGYLDGFRGTDVGSVRVQSPGEVAPSDPPASWATPAAGFTNADIVSFIRAEIAADRVPAPASLLAGGERPIYLVTLRQGLFCPEHPEAVGYHWSFEDGPGRGLCAWVMEGDDLDGTSPISAHELVEVLASETGLGEVADPCEKRNAPMGGINAAAYDTGLHTCALPGVQASSRGSGACLAWKGLGDDAGIYFSALDGDQWQHQRNVPFVGTSDSPSLCVHGHTLYMAWKGMGDDEGIYWSHWEHGLWAPQRGIAGIKTSRHPTLVSYGGQLHMGSKGGTGDNGIYWNTFSRGRWGHARPIPGRATSHGVALLAENALHMAWKGSDDEGIYAATLTGADGSWSAQTGVPGVATSEGPALGSLPAFTGEPDAVLMTWKGATGDQGIWMAALRGGSWSSQTPVEGVGTIASPSVLGTGAGKLWHAWRGSRDDGIWWSTSEEALAWAPQQRIADVGTSHGPALVLY